MYKLCFRHSSDFLVESVSGLDFQLSGVFFPLVDNNQESWQILRWEKGAGGTGS